jgi:hypothetical protein
MHKREVGRLTTFGPLTTAELYTLLDQVSGATYLATEAQDALDKRLPPSHPARKMADVAARYCNSLRLDVEAAYYDSEAADEGREASAPHRALANGENRVWGDARNPAHVMRLRKDRRRQITTMNANAIMDHDEAYCY